MDHAKLIVEEKNNKIYVKAVVAQQRDYPLVPIVVITTEEVKKYLQQNNIDFGLCTQTPKVSVHNKRDHHREGIWVFEKKALDKSVKPAIIKKEKEVRPTPKKRRTRSSTKKVSTED